MAKEQADIHGLPDIILMVDQFYSRVKDDELLAPVFYERIKDNWQPHLETMYRFWNAALFAEKGYVGNPFSRHVTLPLTADHFHRWLLLFNETVDTHFSGPVAENARMRASLMAESFIRRLGSAGDNKSNIIV